MWSERERNEPIGNDDQEKMKIERFDEKKMKKRHQRMLLLHTLADSTLFWDFSCRRAATP